MGNKKVNLPLIVIFLIITLLMAYHLAPQQQSLLQTVRPGYFHFWHFEGVTKQEYVEQGRSIDEVNFPITSKISKIVDECQYATIAYITKELIDNITAHGYTVTVNKITPTVKVEQRRETKQYRDYTIITIYSRIRIDCDVEFETDKPLAESPLPAWLFVLLLALTDKLPAIIIATFVGLGFYVAITTLMNSFKVSSSTVTTEYYDEEGNLIKRVTEHIEGTPFWDIGSWLLIALFGVSILLLIWFVGVPVLGGVVGGKKGRGKGKG